MAISINSVLQLNDGNSIPVFGLGVYESQLNGETEQACLLAFKNGYRMVDTATIYKNEEEVGSAIAKSGLSRDQVFISTKVWNADHGYDKTIAALELSLKKLNLSYVDLYLIHSPKGGHTVDTWKALVELKRRGLAKSIGVSNFNIHHLEKLFEAVPDEIPAVNQVELSLFLQRTELVEYCRAKGIAVQAYSPLTRGKKLDDPRLVEMAKKYGKSPAQILIRWSIQSGYICIPKSVKEERIAQNCDVFNFQISEEDMTSMRSWNENLATCWTVIDDPWVP